MFDPIDMAPRTSSKASGGKNALKPTAAKSKPGTVPASRSKKGTTNKRCSQSYGSEISGQEQDLNVKPAKRRRKAKFPRQWRSSGHFSRESLLGPSAHEVEIPIDHGATFGAGSMANLSWGGLSDQAVSAIAKQRRHRGFRDLGLKRGKKSTFEKFMSMPFPEEDDGESTADENNNNVSLLLRIPLEIRRIIYKFLLVLKLPIDFDSNWLRVCRNASLDFSVLIVSKQILWEGTEYLYETNLFQLSIREPHYSTPGPVIKTNFLQQLRNVVIECARDDCGQKALDMIISNTNNLIQTGTFLDSFTVIISPRRGGYAASGAALDDDTITFLKFFEAPASKLMRRITKLPCKFWNIVVKLSNTKRILISVNMSGTTANQNRGGWFTNDKVVKRSNHTKRLTTMNELLGLKDKIKQIFEEHENAEVAAMDGDVAMLDIGTESATGPNLAEETMFNNLPIQLHQKWDEESEEISILYLRYQNIFDGLVNRFNDIA